MPRPSSRLDLLWVAQPPDRAPDLAALSALVAELAASAPLGAARVWLDAPGGVRLFANQAGGFRVSCPTQGGPVTADFSRAIGAWRGGHARSMACPVCGATHPLEALRYRPDAAFGRVAVVLSNVTEISVPDALAARVRDALGPFREVLRRPA